jgi:hypothetical protein
LFFPNGALKTAPARAMHVSNFKRYIVAVHKSIWKANLDYNPQGKKKREKLQQQFEIWRKSYEAK